MITMLINRGRVEGPQTVDKPRLVNDLRGSPTLSGICGFCGFDDLWGVEEGGGGANGR